MQLSQANSTIRNITVSCVCVLSYAVCSFFIYPSFFIPLFRRNIRVSRRKITVYPLPFFISEKLTGFYKQGMLDHESLSRKLPYWQYAVSFHFDLIRKILCDGKLPQRFLLGPSDAHNNREKSNREKKKIE